MQGALIFYSLLSIYTIIIRSLLSLWSSYERRISCSVDFHSELPVLCTVVKGVDKVVVARGRNLGARKLLNGNLLSNTILQPAALDSGCVTNLEIPALEVNFK